ncbi:MAG TPA: dihydropteroate synthase [Candidatus Binataceae bacterium]|nr:dihydropteroate synthase [Candidatus Binataceae bacterium]
MARPTIIGVVNITEDSFSDGGRYLAPEAAIAHAHQLAADGADIVELGAASSNPDAKEVPAAEEIRRLGPVVDALAASRVAISIDTFKPEVLRWAAARSVAYLNDITGFGDAAIYPELARASCRLIVMHAIQTGARAVRAPADPTKVLEAIFDFFALRIAALTEAGITRERMILDPGMGYFLGSNPEPSLAVLRNIGKLRERFGLPVLISVSRKSFLGAVTGRAIAQRGPATLAAELYATFAGADYVRTHDPGALNDALRVIAAIDAAGR